MNLDGKDRALKRTSAVPERFGRLGHKSRESFATRRYAVQVEWTVTDRPCEECDTIGVSARIEVRRNDEPPVVTEAFGACSC